MSVDYDQGLILEALRRRWPDIPLIGASTDGEISSTGGFQYDSVLLTLFVGEDMTAQATVARDLSKGAEQAVETALSMLAQPGDLCIALPHPATSNASDVIRAIDKGLDPRSCPVVGGLSGDHREFAKFTEFYGDEVLTDSCPILVLGGGLETSVGVGSGWFPLGDSLRITKSKGNVVHEIEGRPALDVFSDQWGVESVGSLGEHPLAVYEGSLESTSVMRAVLDHDPEGRSLMFAGDVPQGALVRFTEVLPEGILDGSRHSLACALKSYGGTSPSIALVFSCAARKWVLGTQIEGEIMALERALQDGGQRSLDFAGFYCFGEIAPHAVGDRSQLHNETCISVVIGH